MSSNVRIKNGDIIYHEGIKYYVEYDDVHLFDEEIVIVSGVRVWYYNTDGSKDELLGEKHRMVIVAIEELIANYYKKELSDGI